MKLYQGSVILLENLRFHIEEEGKGIDSEGNKVLHSSDRCFFNRYFCGCVLLILCRNSIFMVLKNRIAIKTRSLGWMEEQAMVLEAILTGRQPREK